MGAHRLILFIYRAEGARCDPHTLYDHLHGYSEVRSTKDGFGRPFHRTYRYPGIPHRRIMRGVLAVDRKNVRAIEELFDRFDVFHIRCPAPQFVRWDFPRGVR